MVTEVVTEVVGIEGALETEVEVAGFAGGAWSTADNEEEAVVSEVVATEEALRSRSNARRFSR